MASFGFEMLNAAIEGLFLHHGNILKQIGLIK